MIDVTAAMEYEAACLGRLCSVVASSVTANVTTIVYDLLPEDRPDGRILHQRRVVVYKDDQQMTSLIVDSHWGDE